VTHGVNLECCQYMYVCMSLSHVQLFIFVRFLMCTLVLISVLHVLAVRHLQVICTYLLAKTAALCYSVFYFALSVVSLIYDYKSYLTFLN
jgi:hypothetical protein